MNEEIKFPKPKAFSTVKSQKVEFYLKSFLPIPKTKVTMLSGAGGLGKSFLSIQLAVRMIQEDSSRKVLLWLSEDTVGESRERAENILSRVMGFSKEDASSMLRNIDIIGSDAEELTPYINDNSFQPLKEFFSPYALIILDPLIAFYGGDENSNPQARRFVSILTSISTVNLQSILLVHHHGKKDAEGKSSMRGASAFRDAIRVHYEMSFNENGKDPMIFLEKDNVHAGQYLKDKNFSLKILPYDLVIEENFGKSYKEDISEVKDTFTPSIAKPDEWSEDEKEDW